MALLKLVYYSYHPALHKTAEPVTIFDETLATLVKDMYETMYHENGVGLAAPQVGIGQRIATIDVSESRNQPFVIINPEIIERSGEELMEAGCLSIPGTYDKVPRATYVKVRAQDVKGNFFEIEGEGLLGHCLQHEIDHLNGKLYIDYLSALKKRMLLKKMEKFLKK
ncbi:MAG TPA: peptide deformylase [Gammaproteobacteria bacterium]|jgi:peptide deformylase|nr:peptide deformylase [Gammaproteobacteria bacterium]